MTIEKVKRQITLLKKTLQYPPIYMPAIFFFLIQGGRPDISSGVLQFITDQDNGYGVAVAPMHFAGNTAADFGLPEMTTRDHEMTVPDGFEANEWIGCDTFQTYDLGCKGEWLKAMERPSSVPGAHTTGYSFKVTVAAQQHLIYLPDGYSFNYNLVAGEEQVQLASESFTDYQVRLLGLVEEVMDTGNTRNYYKGIEGDDDKSDTTVKGHIFTIVPKLGQTERACRGRSDVCKNVFTPNGVCGGDGTSCGASLLAEVYRTCPVACQECLYTESGNARDGVGTIQDASPHRGCIQFSPCVVTVLRALATTTWSLMRKKGVFLISQRLFFVSAGSSSRARRFPATSWGERENYEVCICNEKFCSTSHKNEELCIIITQKTRNFVFKMMNCARIAAQNVFAAYFLDTPIRKLIFACNVVLFATTFIDLALVTGAYTWFGLGPELFFVLGDRTISYFCGWLGWMPMATLAAQICPASVEATLFGLLMSCCKYTRTPHSSTFSHHFLGVLRL